MAEPERANEIVKRAAFFAQAEADRPTQVIVECIESHRERFGVEPICTVLSEHGYPIAPSRVVRFGPPKLSDRSLLGLADFCESSVAIPPRHELCLLDPFAQRLGRTNPQLTRDRMDRHVRRRVLALGDRLGRSTRPPLAPRARASPEHVLIAEGITAASSSCLDLLWLSLIVLRLQKLTPLTYTRCPCRLEVRFSVRLGDS